MKTLAKANIAAILEAWSAGWEVWAPVRKANGDLLLDRHGEGSLCLSPGKLALPPKGRLLPPWEALFSLEGGALCLPAAPAPALLFGLRSCDLAGIRQTVRFMSRGFDDPYVSRRRDTTLFAVLACPGPQNETCFCPEMRTGPVPEQGYDLLLFEGEEDFLIRAGSDRGAALLTGDLFAEVGGSEGEERIRRFRERALAAWKNRTRIPEAMARLRDKTAREAVWETLGAKCIACGGCVFVCPTCTCFHVHDEVQAAGVGLRARTWDTCLWEGFTREASGHNPRPDQAARLRRRHEHKLLHFQEEDLEGAASGCVGCGRCSDACPVHIGAIEVAAGLCAAAQT